MTISEIKEVLDEANITNFYRMVRGQDMGLRRMK